MRYHITMKRCNKCKIIKPKDQFDVRRYATGVLGHKSRCKACRYEERMAYRDANPKDNNRNKAYNKTNAAMIRGKKLVKNYWPHLTWQEALVEWQRLYNMQDGKCAFGHSVKLLNVDHCHKTGKVRGLLCYI